MIRIAPLHRYCAGWFARRTASQSVTWRYDRAPVFDAEEQCAFHRALYLAYRSFASQHPTWTQRGFDATFLRTDALTPLLMCWASDGAAQHIPTGMDLARIWERKFGMLLCGADRVRQVARLAEAANGLLAALVATRR